jgi:hypothetical protein
MSLGFVIFITTGQPANAIVIGPPVQIGTTTSPLLVETSGVVGSRAFPGVLWMHGDSGDSARFSAVASDGTLLAQYFLDGATNHDWEDLAIGPKPGGGSYLYFGDIGDNNRVRASLQIYRTAEPTSLAGGVIPSSQYDVVNLQYQGLRANAESLMVDPLSGDVFVITRLPGGEVFHADANIFDTPGGTNTMDYLGNIPLSDARAADISPDGRFILVRNKTTTALLWERTPGESVWDAMQGIPIPVTLASEAQGEAIGWAADGRGFYTTSEWNDEGPQPIYFYTFTVPEPSAMVLGMSASIALTGLLLGRSKRRNCPS